MKTKLKKEVWEKEKYWALAEAGSLDTEHRGMKLMLSIASKKKNILDLGCGEGTRLSLIDGIDKKLTGIDLSEIAIKKAKSRNPEINFIQGNIERLPFNDERFDFIYSAFVFEHLDRPEMVIKEALRTLKKGGTLLLIAPNYGAPNRCSPPFKGSRFKKLASGLVKDLFKFGMPTGLGWNKVIPIANKDSYEMDWDTTVEPYLGTLVPYLKCLGLKVSDYFSSWEEEETGAGIIQRVFGYLGEMGLYPFVNWGPHLVVVAEK